MERGARGENTTRSGESPQSAKQNSRRRIKERTFSPTRILTARLLAIFPRLPPLSKTRRPLPSKAWGRMRARSDLDLFFFQLSCLLLCSNPNIAATEIQGATMEVAVMGRDDCCICASTPLLQQGPREGGLNHRSSTAQGEGKAAILEGVKKGGRRAAECAMATVFFISKQKLPFFLLLPNWVFQ